MAKKPKIGHLIHKPNLLMKHQNEARDYHYVRVSSRDGLVDLLLTDADLIRAISRAAKNPEDCYE